MNRSTIPQLLSRSAALYRESFAQSAAILAAGLVPGSLAAAVAFWMTGLTTQYAISEAVNTGDAVMTLPLVAVAILRQVLSVLVFMSLIFAAEARSAGRPLTLGQCFGFAVERFIPFVLTAARAFLYILGGLLLLVVPGIVLAVRYSVAHLAVLIEDLRGPAALARSRELVSAELGFVLGRLALGTLIALVCNVIVALAVSIMSSGASQPVQAGEGQVWSFLADFLSGLIGAWLVCFSVLLYKELAERHPKSLPQ